jgi:hypothetical protein
LPQACATAKAITARNRGHSRSRWRWRCRPRSAFAVLAQEIVGGLFQRGAFGPHDTAMAAAALAAISAGLPGHSLEKVLGAVSFAHEETRTPMYTALCGPAAAVTGAVVLFPRYGIVGMDENSTRATSVQRVRALIIIFAFSSGRSRELRRSPVFLSDLVGKRRQAFAAVDVSRPGGECSDHEKIFVSPNRIGTDKPSIGESGLTHVMKQAGQFEHGIVRKRKLRLAGNDQRHVGHAIEDKLRLWRTPAEDAAEIDLDLDQAISFRVHRIHEWLDRVLPAPSRSPAWSAPP